MNVRKILLFFTFIFFILFLIRNEFSDIFLYLAIICWSIEIIYCWHNGLSMHITTLIDIDTQYKLLRLCLVLIVSIALLKSLISIFGYIL